MELNIGQWVVIGLCAVLLFGYIRGFYYNRQRAAQALSWLHEGLKTFGPVSVGEKLPGMATGGRLEVKNAVAPFHNVEAVYLLAPRENLFFWIFHLLRGKGDELILWVTYQSKPGQDVEAAYRGERQFENRIKAADKKPLAVSEGPHRLLIASEEKKNAALAGKVRTFLERYGHRVRRLALRGNKPHLFLRADLRIIRSESADEFFSALRDLVN